MDYTNIIAQNLKMLRSYYGLSFETLARNADLAKSTVQSLEQGRSHNLSTLQVIADFYRIPLPVLFDDKYMQHPELLLCFLRAHDWFFRLSPEDGIRLATSMTEYLDLLIQFSNKMQQ